jgi:hypothetical protein
LWSEWTDCSATCGGGLSTRRRSCTYPEPQFGGKDCLSAIGPGTETKTCRTEKCPGRSMRSVLVDLSKRCCEAKTKLVFLLCSTKLYSSKR